MNPIIIFAFIFIVAIIIITSLFFNKKALIKRKLRKAESKHLSHFKDGDTAKIVGQIEFTNTPLTAPLSDRKCAYYYVHIEQKVSSGKNSHWDTIIEEEVSGDFVIRDGTNHAFINDKNIKSFIVQDKSYKSGFLNDAPQYLESYLASKGHESENMLGLNKTIRYREGVLEENEKVAVYGQGVWKSAETLNIPERYGRVLEITSTTEDPIYFKRLSRYNTRNN